MKAVLTKIVKETGRISSFRLQPERPMDYLPGQWFYVQLAPDLKHHFTLSSSPTEPFLQFTTMYRQESEYKRALWSKQVGDKLEITGPFGNFILDETDTSPKLFIAGGIGIAPFRSMIRYAIDKDLQIPVTLLYSVKTKSDGAFVGELSDLRFKNYDLRIVETEREDRLDEDKIKALVPDWRERAWWLCGPPAMVEAFTELAQKLGLPPEKVKSEEFTGYE